MPVSQAQKKAVRKYETKTYDKILIRIRNDGSDNSGLSREAIQKAADAAGMSLNAFILSAVSDKINK